MSLILRGYGKVGLLVLRGYGRIARTIVRLISQIFTWIAIKGRIGTKTMTCKGIIEKVIVKSALIHKKEVMSKSRIDSQNIVFSKVTESIVLNSLLKAG